MFIHSNLWRGGVSLTTAVALGCGSTVMTGCESLPGSDEQQGAVIGGVGGAVAGAAIAGDNRLLGALIGGALGAGGGYLIGANKDKILGEDRDEAEDAMEQARRNPADADDVDHSTTADLNEDGFVTMDEVVAMEEAGLSNDEILERLEDTGQVFELTADQEDYLRQRGVSRKVIDEMQELNADTRQAVLRERERDARDDDVLGMPDDRD